MSRIRFVLSRTLIFKILLILFSWAGDNSSSKIIVSIKFDFINELISLIFPFPINVFGLGLSIFWKNLSFTMLPAVSARNSSSSKNSFDFTLFWF